jgi:hypothetical protein
MEGADETDVSVFRTDGMPEPWEIDDNYDGLANDAQMVFGDTIPNPYRVSRMQQAFEFFNELVPESPFSEKTVEATHHYIKITLNSYEQIEVLDEINDSEGLEAPLFFMQPLHLETLEDGDYYYDISEVEHLSHIDMTQYPVYTVIESDYSLPAELNYQLLEELYKPTHEEHIVKLIAYQMAGWNNRFGGFGLPDHMDTLALWVADYPDFEGIYPPDFEPDPPEPDGPAPGGGSGSGFSSSNTHGRITIQNTQLNTSEPVPHLLIRYGRYFWWNRTITNEEGWFDTKKRYNGTIWVRADWRHNWISMRERPYEWIGFFVQDHLMKIRDGALRRIKRISHSSSRKHVWNKGTIYTGICKYNDYCEDVGISEKVTESVVWVSPLFSSASNPMLYTNRPILPLLSNYMNLSEINTFRGLFEHLLFGVLNSVINALPIHLPDQIYGIKNKRNTQRMHQVVFHESAHYSHAKQAGYVYWAKTYADQFKNVLFADSPRGDGTEPSSAAGQRIALVEGCADLAEVIIALAVYEEAHIASSNSWQNGLHNQIIVLDNLEDFHVHDVPVDINVTLDRGWLLHGLMWDLLDDEVDDGTWRLSGDGVPLNLLEDNVFIGNPTDIFDLSPIFNLLTSGVENAADLRTAVLNAYPAQTTEINALFDSYGY